jgi:RNA polymerase sigma-70 factor (ECF subfamily)
LNDDIRQLIRRCLLPDQAAMVELVERFKGQVFGLCYRMLGQRQDAEDAAQETFVRVLKNLHRWDAARDFEPWLLAIAGNRCRTALAKRVKRSNVQPLADDDSVAESGGFDLAAARGLAEEVQLAMQRLREEYRQAFVLFHEQELSYAEIAEMMDCPVGTVKTWIHRARLEMMQFLKSRGIGQEMRHAVRKV